MKKILSVLLVVLMLTSTLAMFVSADFDYAPDGSKSWKPTKSEWEAVEKGNDVVARFVIGADIHMDHYNSYNKLQNAYDVSEQIGGVDALMIAGDLTHYGYDNEYAPLMENINKNTTANSINPNATGNKVGATILSMGNHDFGHSTNNGEKGSEDFKRNTGMDACALYWINDVPVIALSPSDGTRSPSQVENGKEFGNNYDGRIEFVQQSYAAIDATGYTGPIIVIAHHRTPASNIGKIIDGSKGRNEYYPTEILKEFRDHPNTIIFTGHSHTWINDMGSFILQNNNGFTHVRAGTLGNDYGNSDGAINASDGINQTIVKDYTNDLNCSAVLVDVMSDGTAQLRALDLAKGEYIFDEVFTIDYRDVDYYNTSANKAGTYSENCQAPSFPADAASQITVEDLGNNSSVIVSFPEATPATSSAKDSIDYYFIKIADSKGNVVQEDGMGYVKTPNYRHSSKKGTPFTVKVNSLAWDTDYTVTIWAESSYGLKSQEIVYSGTVNIGHGTPTYPAKPVYDVDFSYGNTKDAQGHNIVVNTNPLSSIVDDATIGQKVMNYYKFNNTGICYDFQDADYRRIQNSYVLEAYFSVANSVMDQAICGAWTGARLALRVAGSRLTLYADYLSRNEDQREVASVNIKSNTWYHVVAVYDGISTKLYVNGELKDTETGCSGGLKTSYSPPSDDPDAEDEAVKGERILFCVGSMDNSDGEMSPVQTGARINKAALYEGIWDEDDVKLAYDIAKTDPGFTDVKDTWYTDSVEYAKAAGLMKGTGNGTTFEPNTKTTRAMIVQLIYALEGSPAVEYKSTFKDVAQKDWYSSAIIWANENGIAAGIGKDKFSPNGLVTREQVAAFLYRYLKNYKGVEMEEGADLSVFPDENKISTSGDLKDAIAWANASGIINGKSSGGTVYLAPQDKATRAEAASMITSFHKKFA